MTWQAERARTVGECLREVSAARSVRGWAAAKAAELKGARYQDGRRVRLSAGTLLRLYYAWERDGNSAFRLNYKGGPRYDRAIIAEFQTFCEGCKEAMSFEGAYRLFKAAWEKKTGRPLKASVQQLRRAFAWPEGNPLAALFQTRREKRKPGAKMPQDDLRGVDTAPEAEKLVLKPLSSQSDAVLETVAGQKGGA